MLDPVGQVDVPFVQATRWSQAAPPTQEAVTPYRYGCVVRGRARLRRCLDGPDEVAADHDFRLDDGLAAEHDVLGADERGLASDLVARVRLNVFASRGPSRGHVGGYSALLVVLVVESSRVVCCLGFHHRVRVISGRTPVGKLPGSGQC
jgi:hypothetical protein